MRQIGFSVMAEDLVARTLLEQGQTSYRKLVTALGMTPRAVGKRYPGAGARPAGASHPTSAEPHRPGGEGRSALVALPRLKRLHGR